jgi:hypothetical protein
VEEGESGQLVEGGRVEHRKVRPPGWVSHRNATAATNGQAAELGDGECQGQGPERIRQESIPDATRAPRSRDEYAQGSDQQGEPS